MSVYVAEGVADPCWQDGWCKCATFGAGGLSRAGCAEALILHRCPCGIRDSRAGETQRWPEHPTNQLSHIFAGLWLAVVVVWQFDCSRGIRHGMVRQIRSTTDKPWPVSPDGLSVCLSSTCWCEEGGIIMGCGIAALWGIHRIWVPILHFAFFPPHCMIWEVQWSQSLLLTKKKHHTPVLRGRWDFNWSHNQLG